MTGDPWAVLVDRHWTVAPAVVPAPPPLTVGEAYRLIAKASVPFRAGTRFHVLPDVHFDTAAGRIRAPGHLLPGTADADPDAYRERLGAELAGQGWLLAVDQPLFADFASWARVRDRVTALWRRVGFPVVPVGAELVFGDGVTRADALARDSHHAVLAWVLRGRLRVDAHGGPTLRVGPGEAGYWPAGLRWTETVADDCLALLLRVPGDARLPVDAVHRTVVELAAESPAAEDTVPYLPLPDPAGPVAVADPLARATTAVRQLSTATDLTRTLRVRWAARVSAGGLEPVPAPRDPARLAAGQWVCRTAEVVRMPDGRSRWIWAANGHAFTVQGAAGRLLRRLRPDVPVRVDDLCGTDEDGRPDAGALGLLTTLHRLRAVEVTDGPEPPAGKEG
ncbi:hypothetical protein [Micromonospora sagamiensis]|uniref:Uncharacterized protein n=1 Tax=Micromonospora sagamiensis TaxID=47875 RepID=A0A562WI91_9ACTN|nr:hypothetical protein [Micromonospora sagamiensis]TWJ29607.1 hypothetical protein JD81_03118 [Micromonospora sagamiensis]BCL17364.1 hypothetical protein GCM10017556_51030 [Micromonospora sagamiensis]